jgi:hypothetical protein
MACLAGMYISCYMYMHNYIYMYVCMYMLICMYMHGDMYMRRGVRVARQTFVTLVDDLDGGPADETVRFGIEGARYEIDLSRENAARLRRQLAPFIERGRPAGTGVRRPRRTAASRRRSQDIRAWAREQGLELRDRGRIPASVAERYQAAVGGTAGVLAGRPRGQTRSLRTGSGEFAPVTTVVARIVAAAHRNPPGPDVYSGHAPLSRSPAVRSRRSLRALRDRCRDIGDTAVSPGPDTVPGQLRLHRGRRDHLRPAPDAAARGGRRLQAHVRAPGPGHPGARDVRLASLNAGGETVPGVNYTVIESRDDEVVTPYTSAFLTGSNVTNITVQNQCPLDQSDHLEIAADPIAMADMLNALDPAHPVRVPCLAVLPVTGPEAPVPAF